MVPKKIEGVTPRCSTKRNYSEIFPKFTGKHQCQNLYIKTGKAIDFNSLRLNWSGITQVNKKIQNVNYS